LIAKRFEVFDANLVKLCQGRSFGAQRSLEAVELLFRAFHFDGDAERGIENVPAKLVPLRELVHPGPEADALHDAVDLELTPQDKNNTAIGWVRASGLSK
jgi:hypothetical protein